MNYYKIRLMIPRPLKNMIRTLSYLTIFSDPGSCVRYYKVVNPTRQPLSATIDVRVRSLNGHPIRIRTRGTDASVILSTFLHQFHVPPKDVFRKGSSLILDLGSNIGCTIAHLACLYPQAQVVGVELDSANAGLCRHNIAPWEDRCRVIEGAVWAEDGDVQYEHREGCEDGLSVGAKSGDGRGRLRTVQALSLNTIISEVCSPGQTVDYVKMDIEGAEREILGRNTDWAARVRSIKVELHGDYSKQDCVADLQRLGFRAWADNNHALCVVGVKR